MKENDTLDPNRLICDRCRTATKRENCEIERIPDYGDIENGGWLYVPVCPRCNNILEYN